MRHRHVNNLAVPVIIPYYFSLTVLDDSDLLFTRRQLLRTSFRSGAGRPPCSHGRISGSLLTQAIQAARHRDTGKRRLSRRMRSAPPQSSRRRQLTASNIRPYQKKAGYPRRARSWSVFSYSSGIVPNFFFHNVSLNNRGRRTAMRRRRRLSGPTGHPCFSQPPPGIFFSSGINPATSNWLNRICGTTNRDIHANTAKFICHRINKETHIFIITIAVRGHASDTVAVVGLCILHV